VAVSESLTQQQLITFELLTTGHDIATGTIIRSLADASLKLMKEADETCRM
jgi:hypothetical protein